jgi:hypothetical protein
VLADHLVARSRGNLRVAIDGAAGLDPAALADRLLEPLRARGRPAVHIRAETFWRDASLRLEYGHTDEYSLRHDWLDAAALQREVLDPLGPDGAGTFVPSLRDPVTNRSTHERPRAAAPGTVILVSGQLLLDHALPFDQVLRLSASAATLARATPPELAWTLPVIAAYEADVDPSEKADVDIRLNDPRHPAVRIRG